MSNVENDAKKYAKEALDSLYLFLAAAGEHEKKALIQIALESAFRAGHVRGYGDATTRKSENPAE